MWDNKVQPHCLFGARRRGGINGKLFTLSLPLPLFVVGDFILLPRGHAALDNDSEITSDSAMTHNLHGEVCVPICVWACAAQNKQTYVDSPIIGWAYTALIVLSRQKTKSVFGELAFQKKVTHFGPSRENRVLLPKKHLLRLSIIYCATSIPPSPPPSRPASFWQLVTWPKLHKQEALCVSV